MSTPDCVILPFTKRFEDEECGTGMRAILLICHTLKPYLGRTANVTLTRLERGLRLGPRQ